MIIEGNAFHSFHENVFSVKMLPPLSASGNVWLNCILPLGGTSPKIPTVLCSGLSTPSSTAFTWVCQPFQAQTVFVCSGCHNKTPQAGCLKQQTFIPYRARDLAMQNQGASKVGHMLKTLPLARRHGMLTWPLLCVHMVWGAIISSSFSTRALITSWGTYPHDYI